MLIKNWNILDDNYLNDKEVRQREDAREAQYQRDTEKYKLSIGDFWLVDKPNKNGDATIAVADAKDALVMHSPELQQVIDMLEDDIVYGINVWHWCPIARLDVDTAQLLLNGDAKDKDEELYIVQHDNGWVSNGLYKYHHWQIATSYTLDEAYRIAKSHRNLSKTFGDYTDAWILKLGWAKENLVDIRSKNV